MVVLECMVFNDSEPHRGIRAAAGLKEGGFEFNAGSVNGLELKYVKATNTGRHGPHPPIN
jgi:hypothetical protein